MAVERCCKDSGGGGTTTTISANFVLRQGEPNPTGNVYATWASLAPVLAATPGPKIVAIDRSLSSVANITAGTWPVQGTTFVGLPSQFGGVIVELDPGAVLVDPWGIDHGLTMVGMGTGAAQIVLTDVGIGGPVAFVVGLASSIYSNSGQPIFRVGPGEFYVLAALNGGGIGGIGNPVVSLDDPSAGFVAGLASFGQLASDSVVGSGAWIVQYEDSGILPDTFNGFTGTYVAFPQAQVPNATIYVNASNGSDTQGNGSSRRPFRTLTKAIAVAQASNLDSIIYLSPGTYGGAILPSLRALTIEGQGGDTQDQSSVVINAVGSPALVLSPAPADADNIKALTLRNLQVVSDTIALQTINGSAPGGFLEYGVKLDNVRLTAPVAWDIQNAGFAMASESYFAGLINATQLGQGILLNSEGDSDLTVSYDSSQPAPSVGRLPFSLQGTTLKGNVLIAGNPWIQINETSKVANVFDIGLLDLGGQGITFEDQGKQTDISLSLPEPSGLPPTINLDNSRATNVFVGPINSIPGGPRFAVSARNVTWAPSIGNTGIGERTDFDMIGGSYNRSGVVTGGGGADKGTFDRSIDFENGSLLGGPVNLTFGNPFPAGATYTVTIEYTTTPVANAKVFNKTSVGFDYEGPLGGGACQFTINRYS